MIAFSAHHMSGTAISHQLHVCADFGLSINEGQSTPRSMEIGTPGYCGASGF